MKKETGTPSDKRHRFPPAIIAHAVWLYCRFARSYRDAAALLAERGVMLTDASVSQWCRKFGQAEANERRRRRPQPGDTWHPDAAFVQIDGRKCQNSVQSRKKSGESDEKWGSSRFVVPS